MPVDATPILTRFVGTWLGGRSPSRPATAAELAAAESRLGRPLPRALRAWYELVGAASYLGQLAGPGAWTRARDVVSLLIARYPLLPLSPVAWLGGRRFFGDAETLGVAGEKDACVIARTPAAWERLEAVVPIWDGEFG